MAGVIINREKVEKAESLSVWRRKRTGNKKKKPTKPAAKKTKRKTPNYNKPIKGMTTRRREILAALAKASATRERKKISKPKTPNMAKLGWDILNGKITP